MWYLRLAYFLGTDPQDLARLYGKSKPVMNTTDCHLIVFAKAPVPGQVKTRLIPSLGTSGAAALYEQLVLHILSIAIDAHVGSVDLWCTPSLNHPFFFQCAQKFQIILFNQIEGDLGSRMAHAFQ